MRKFLIALFCLAGFLACKTEPGSKVNKSSQANPQSGNTATDGYNESETGFRAEAATEIARRSLSSPKPPAVIEADLWQYAFVYENGAMSEEGSKAGEWIDFKIDNTYEYGKYGKSKGSGSYHHDFDTQRIIMLDAADNVIPREFETKFGGDILILVGRPLYGNNGTQMKLERITAKPVK